MELVIISMNTFIDLVMDEAQNELSLCTYPVFATAKNNRPELIGTSVVIELDSKLYLVTASHVITYLNKENSAFHIASGNSFVEIKGNVTRSVHKNKDHFDIAFIEISSDFANLNNIGFLSQSRLLVGRKFHNPLLSFIHGYPCSKNKQASALMGGTVFRSYAFSYAGKINRNFENWSKYNKDPEVHICMNYGKAVDMHGNHNIPPSPRGISGGGLWVMPNMASSKVLYLSGIFIEYFDSPNISFSTRIDLVVDFIRKNI